MFCLDILSTLLICKEKSTAKSFLPVSLRVVFVQDCTFTDLVEAACRQAEQDGHPLPFQKVGLISPGVGRREIEEGRRKLWVVKREERGETERGERERERERETERVGIGEGEIEKDRSRKREKEREKVRDK